MKMIHDEDEGYFYFIFFLSKVDVNGEELNESTHWPVVAA